MEPAAFKALYSAEKPKLEENLIFFCQMGKRGLQATQLAQSLGYKGYGLGKWAGAVVPGDCLLASVLPSPLFFFTGLGTMKGPIENGSRKKVR